MWAFKVWEWNFSVPSECIISYMSLALAVAAFGNFFFFIFPGYILYKLHFADTRVFWSSWMEMRILFCIIMWMTKSAMQLLCTFSFPNMSSCYLFFDDIEPFPFLTRQKCFSSLSVTLALPTVNFTLIFFRWIGSFSLVQAQIVHLLWWYSPCISTSATSHSDAHCLRYENFLMSDVIYSVAPLSETHWFVISNIFHSSAVQY